MLMTLPWIHIMTLEALTGLDGKLEVEVPFFSLPIRLFSCLAGSCVAGRPSNRLNYAERCRKFFELWKYFAPLNSDRAWSKPMPGISQVAPNSFYSTRPGDSSHRRRGNLCGQE